MTYDNMHKAAERTALEANQRVIIMFRPTNKTEDWLQGKVATVVAEVPTRPGWFRLALFHPDARRKICFIDVLPIDVLPLPTLTRVQAGANPYIIARNKPRY